MLCDSFTSCATCIAQQPPPGVDFGIRCVWCESESACREYNKFTLHLPCADALRGGGGYPGGASCDQAGSRVAAAPPRLPPRLPVQAYTRFAHAPQTAHPVSVVIPSHARPHNLPHQLLWLLQLEPLHRAGSEIIISHGSLGSWEQRDAIDRGAAEACAATTGAPPAAPGCADRPVRHVDSTARNAEHFTAHRYFAAARSANEVLLHLDDDLVPGEAMLQALTLARPRPISPDLARGRRR